LIPKRFAAMLDGGMHHEAHDVHEGKAERSGSLLRVVAVASFVVKNFALMANPSAVAGLTVPGPNGC
jgi:hypothetical protein